MSQALVKALTRLVEVYPDSVAGSAMTPSQKKQLDEFSRKTQSVQTTPKGRGVVYRILDMDVVKVTLEQLAPNQNVSSSAPQRAVNIASTRSSKQGRAGHDVSYMLAKTVANPLWRVSEVLTEHLKIATEEFGVFSLEVGGERNRNLHTHHSIWLVENQALFDRLDWLPNNEPTTVIWYRGQLHNKLIEWLSAPDRATMVYFFSDYDGVGLNNYRRLRSKLEERAEFWLMPNWKELLVRYGQNQLWNDTAREFDSFEQNSQRLLLHSPPLRELVTQMKKHGLALEQEAVWLSDTYPQCELGNKE
ncbi:Wadjet anti-phage system protein JetD domain-containing protein [Vibrio splendidus]